MKFGSESTVKTNASGVAAGGFVIGDFAAIKHILANQIYKNPIQTLVQEYLSNARDALRAANNPNGKIVVKVPHETNASWSVRDYGIGMDDNDVRSVFTAYGVSTKRANDVQTGGFGIGSKSAFAYAKTFVVVAYKNGVRREYIMATETPDHPAGSFIQTVEEKTSEPDGVEIQIPVEAKDFDKFRNATFRTIEFWDNRPEIIGAEFSSEEPIARTKHAQFFDGHAMGKVFIILDGIPYPCPESIYKRDSYDRNEVVDRVVRKLNCSIGIEFSTGELSPASTREDIQDSPQNRKAIEERAKKVSSEIDEFVAKSLASTTIEEMFKRSRFVEKLFSVQFENSVTVGGEVFSYKSAGSVFMFGSGIEGVMAVDGRYTSSLRVDRSNNSSRHFHCVNAGIDGIYIRTDRMAKFVQIDETITMADVLRKLEQNFSERGEFVILSSETNRNKLDIVCEALGAVKTSGLSFTKPQRAKRSEGTVSYMTNLSERNSCSIDEMAGKKYVYAPSDDRTMMHELFKSRDVREFVGNSGCESVGLSSRAVKQLEEAGIVVVRLDKFLTDSAAIVGSDVRNFVIKRHLSRYRESFESSLYYAFRFIEKHKDSLNDTLVDVVVDISTMEKRIAAQFPFNRSGYVPSKVEKEIISSAASQMAQFVDIVEEARKIFAKIPMLAGLRFNECCDVGGSDEEKAKFKKDFEQHLIEYVNTRLGGGK